jgi:hypothetical protein
MSTSSKDSCNLHRWVLIKNSIVNSHSSTLPPTMPDTHHDSVDEEDDDDADEVLDSVEVVDSFMFPDAGKLVSESSTDEAKASEAQWLDSLLETLGDDDDDDFSVDSEHHMSALAVDDDEFPLYSPIVSSMSSSGDQPNPSPYYPTSSISVQYPVPYPPYHPPNIHAFHFDTTLVSSFSPPPPPPSPSPHEEPLPYYDLDDLEDLPVPDAIEDTSDDESDALTTPSLGRSSSSLTLVDPASVPLPVERSSRLRHSDPRVYIDVDDPYFCFEIDPLPFPDEHLTTSYNHYQEC